jgi:prefoldin subunit 5
MKTWELADNSEKEVEDALEFYMKRCAQLQEEVKELRETIKRLKWSMEEHD